MSGKIDFSFEEFALRTTEAYNAGEIKFSPDYGIRECDLAIEYTIGRLWEMGVREVAIADIPAYIKLFCGKDVYDRVMKEGGCDG